MGIEPTSEAWEASILPLYDARSPTNLTKRHLARKHHPNPDVPTLACASSLSTAISYIACNSPDGRSPAPWPASAHNKSLAPQSGTLASANLCSTLSKAPSSPAPAHASSTDSVSALRPRNSTRTRRNSHALSAPAGMPVHSRPSPESSDGSGQSLNHAAAPAFSFRQIAPPLRHQIHTALPGSARVFAESYPSSAPPAPPPISKLKPPPVLVHRHAPLLIVIADIQRARGPGTARQLIVCRAHVTSSGCNE